ncbi:hypothetical protein [Arthrobacter sp. GAS37]|uniref:hypothetical protein n=1 Tax=Arthrobacter sp. GAS37 TaxID=3156261 RepID=UPI003850DC61
MLILSIFAAFAALARFGESTGSVIFANGVLGVQKSRALKSLQHRSSLKVGTPVQII